MVGVVIRLDVLRAFAFEGHFEDACIVFSNFHCFTKLGTKIQSHAGIDRLEVVFELSSHSWAR